LTTTGSECVLVRRFPYEVFIPSAGREFSIDENTVIGYLDYETKDMVDALLAPKETKEMVI